MYKQKLIKLSNENQKTNNYTTYFNQNVTIPPNSSIALVNANIELNDGFIEVSEEFKNNAITFSNTITNAQQQFIDHRATIPDGNYTMEKLADEFTKALNSRLYFTGNDSGYIYRRDTGSEIKMIYDKSTLKHKLYYSARSKEEQQGFPTNSMNLGNPVKYFYDLNGKKFIGTLKRTAATIIDIQNEDFCNSTQVFTHGSGIITLADFTSKYSYKFTATAENVLTPNAPLPIAKFPYTDANSLYISIITSGSISYVYDITKIADDGTNITSITVKPGDETVPDIENGEEYIVYMDDPVNLQGFCCGLIRASDINSTNIFNDIKYGIMILPNNNTMIDPITGYTYIGGNVYVKNYDDWKDSGILFEGVLYPDGVARQSIAFVLGRLEDMADMNTANMNDYKMRIVSMSPNEFGQLAQIQNKFLTADYVDDDYIFVYATMQQNGVFTAITYTQSKLINSTEIGKYYVGINPELDEIKSIDITKNIYSVDPLGWTKPDEKSYITVKLYNQTMVDMLGFTTDDDFTMQEQVNNKPDMEVTFQGRYPVSPNWSLPSNFNISIPNLDIESYINGSKSSVIYSLGHQVVNSRYFSFTPPEVMLLSLNNISPISLNSLTVRIEDDDGNLTVEQANSSVTLLIRTYIDK